MSGSTAVVVGAWMIVIGAIVWRFRPPPTRANVLGTTAGTTLPVLLGSRIRRLLHRPNGGAEIDAQVGWTILTAVAGVAVIGPAGLALAALSWAWSVHRRRVRRRQLEGAVSAELPDVIELLSLGLRSGLSVRATIELVVPHLRGVIADGLAGALAIAEDGGSFADGLERLPAVDVRLRPLTGLLLASLRNGDSIVDGLDRLAGDARVAERRSQEEKARRLPVTMLLPLVFGVLPAFVLLTIVPVVATGVVSLRLP